MRLPKWASYCERCGAQVSSDGANADPLEHVGLEDTVSEPLWEEAEEAPEAKEPFALTSAPEPLVGMTVPMGEDEIDQAEASVATVAWKMSEEELAAHQSGESSPEQEAVKEDGASADEEDPSDDSEKHDEGSEEDHPSDDEGSDASSDDEEASETGDDADSLEESEGETRDETSDGDSSDADQPVEGIPLPYNGGYYGGYEYATDLETIHADTPATWQGAVGHNRQSATGHGLGNEAWQGRTRPSERRDARPYASVGRETPSLAAFVAIALALVLAAGAITAVQRSLSAGVTRKADGKPVSETEAAKIIESLDGWWKTDRTLDGRYWYINARLLEQYGADGKLNPSQKLIEPRSVERMRSGPGDIEGEGYYLRDVGFYLVDGEPDVLHVISQDGSADEEANLHRTDPPEFLDKEPGETSDAEQPAEGDASEYILPESSTRIYTTDELEGLSDHDLFVARNEVFARHGYTFMPGELSEYFSSKSWYHPSDSFNEAELNEFERENVSTILSIEQSRGSQYQ